jgi:hypothetical protein
MSSTISPRSAAVDGREGFSSWETPAEGSPSFRPGRTRQAPEDASGTGLPAQAGFLQGIAERRERDSNPRTGKPVIGFRDRPDRPLRHLSEVGDAIIEGPLGREKAACRPRRLPSLRNH